MAGFKVVLANQDISAFVDETTLTIESVLAQGAGTGGSGSRTRSTTARFLTTLGPAAMAYGAGQTLPSSGGPYLVREGKVQVYDSAGVNVFTGYVAKLDDKTDKLQTYTQVECYDIWQEIDRTTVNKSYTNQTDVAIITDLFSTYAPTISTSGMPSPALVIPVISFQETTLQKAVQSIADITGYQVSITPGSQLIYQPLSAAASAPFALSDQNVDGLSVCAMWVDSFQQDDTAAINRVTLLGGTVRSVDFTQELTNQITASNKTFTFAYTPYPSSNGAIQVHANGVSLAVGYANSSDALHSAGGTKDVLINQDQKNAIFDTVPAAPLTATFQFTAPLVITVTDPASYAFFGRYLDGQINDSQIADVPTALVRCRALLAEQSFGLTHFTLHTRSYGLSAGQRVQVDHFARGIHGVFQVQKVTYEPQGNGIFYYAVELGAWQWNLVDMLLQISDALFNENNLNPSTVTITDQVFAMSVHALFALTSSTRTPGGYYARTAPVGDGHDAYGGLSTITS